MASISLSIGALPVILQQSSNSTTSSNVATSEENKKSSLSSSSGDGKKKAHDPAMWKKYLAGSVAGIADCWVCHPLDRIKTHMQQQSGRTIVGSAKEIYAKGGMRSLYEGVLPMTAEAIAKVGMRYTVFAYVKDLWKHHVQGETDPKVAVSVWGNVIGGAMAGVVESVLVVIPCELLKVRHMTSTTHETFATVLNKTVKQDGFLGLYRGGTSTLLRQVTNQMIRFPVFYASSNYIKEQTGQKSLNPFINLGLGGFAAVTSSVFNTPLDTIKTRMQKVGSTLSTKDVMREIYAERGITGFWAGFTARATRVVPGQAITFFVFEAVLEMLEGEN